MSTLPTLPPDSAIVSIPQLINWIILPHETISEYGSWRGVLITPEIAQWTATIDNFSKHGHIEIRDNKLYLWRRKDWESEYEQIRRRKALEETERMTWMDDKGRFKRLVHRFTFKNPLYKQTHENMKLAEEILFMLVREGKKGNKDAKEQLEELGYYEELD